MNISSLIACAMIGFTLCACGVKGDLVRPQNIPAQSEPEESR